MTVLKSFFVNSFELFNKQCGRLSLCGRPAMASVHIVGEISGAVRSVPVLQCRGAARAALPCVLCFVLGADRGLLVLICARRAERRSGAQLLADEQVAQCPCAGCFPFARGHPTR